MVYLDTDQVKTIEIHTSMDLNVVAVYLPHKLRSIRRNLVKFFLELWR